MEKLSFSEGHSFDDYSRFYRERLFSLHSLTTRNLFFSIKCSEVKISYLSQDLIPNVNLCLSNTSTKKSNLNSIEKKYLLFIIKLRRNHWMTAYARKKNNLFEWNGFPNGKVFLLKSSFILRWWNWSRPKLFYF